MRSLLPLITTFALAWLLLIRPQQKRVKAHQAIVASLVAGDQIVVSGGIHGTITRVEDDTMMVEVAPGVELKVLKAAVTHRVATDVEPLDGSTADDSDK